MAQDKATRPPLGDFIAKYRQYKDDTLNISSWLAENALKCGFDIKAPSTAKVGGGRLKGKDRKKAKEAAAKSSSAAAPSGPQYIIQVSQFVPMAQAIASYTPKPNVPPALNRLFDRVIEARRQFGSWYAGMSTPGSRASASDERHTHFVEVLQATWEVLVPFEEARKTSKPSPKTADENKSKGGLLVSLENRFANLHVERPSESSGSHDASIPPPPDNESYRLPTSINVQLQRDEEEVERDFFLGIYSFLCELSDARSYIEGAWEDAATDPDKFPQAALQSNLVIQLVRRAEMSLDNFLERPKKFPASTYPTWAFPFIMLYERSGFLEPSAIAKFPRTIQLDRITKPDFNVMPSGSISTFAITGEWEDFCFARPFIVFHYAIHRSKHMRGGISPGALDVDGWCKDEGELEIFKTFNRIQTVAITTDGGNADDEVTKGVRVATETKTVPTWAIFGFQCLLDINKFHKTDESSMFGGPLYDLQRHVSMAAKNLKDIDIERLKPPMGPTPPHIEDLSRLIRDMEDEVMNGSLTRPLISTRPLTGALPPYLLDPDFFLECNPIRCGLMHYNLRLQLYERALAFDTGLLMLIPMVHLYKMCRLVYPEMRAWPDMEFFLLHQDVDRLFFGGVPRSLAETSSKYHLAMGVSATALSKMKRTGKMTPLNFDRMRFAQNPCPIGSILAPSLGGYAKDDDLVLLELLRWLNDPKKLEIADSLLDRQPQLSAEALETLGNEIGTTEQTKQQMRETFPFPHASIADTIRFSDIFMQGERDILNFDWVEFMYTANEMATHISTILGRYYPNTYEEWNGIFSGMLMELVHEADTAEKHARKNSSNSASLAEIAPPALKEICDAMQARGLTRAPDDKRKVNTKNGKKKAVWWTMDRGVASVIRRYDFGAMSFLTAGEQFVRDHLYQNWPAEDLERSYTIQKIRAFYDDKVRSDGLDKEWKELDGEAGGWADVEEADDVDDNEDGSGAGQRLDPLDVEGYLRGLLLQQHTDAGVEMNQETLDQIMGSLMQKMPQELLDSFRNARTPRARERLTRALKKRLGKLQPIAQEEGLQDVEGWMRGVVRRCLPSGGQGGASNAEEDDEEVLEMLTSTAMDTLPPEYLAALQRPHTLEFREEVAERLSALYTRLFGQAFASR